MSDRLPDYSEHQFVQRSKIINNLPLVDYSQTNRKQIRTAGESTAIGKMDPNDRFGMQRLKIIDIAALGTMVGGRNTTPELLRFAKRGIEKGGVAFGVFGSHAKGLSSQEIGELQGWVIFYKDTHVRRLKELGLIKNPSKPVIEISRQNFQGYPITKCQAQ